MVDSDYVALLPIPDSKRLNNLVNFFTTKFSDKPDFIARVPGRVNLIGEHIDYCGYGVCPMALDVDVTIAAKIIFNCNDLVITNVDPNYPEYKCDINGSKIELEIGQIKWYNYVLCGVKGIADYLNGKVFEFGLNISVSGNIPPGSGLSSSSALVGASVLTMAYASKLNLTKQQLGDISATCERYIGTQGGGMDQAIAFLGNEGCAKFIQFNPLRATTVMLPAGATFVISHSLARKNKAASSDFNCRVMECKIAAKILAKINKIQWEDIAILKDLQTKLNLTLPDMIKNVNENLHVAPYTKEELCSKLELTVEEFEDILSYNTKHMVEFKLKERALHVYEEALRVEQFVNICDVAQKTEPNSLNDSALESLGQILNSSHESLKTQYECSHENLDKLIDLSKGIAFGARLTGAGWGGCAVALVKQNSIEAYINKLRQDFYQNFNVEENINELLFATSPKSGACIYKL